MAAQPTIADHAIIGDLQTAALVASNGDVSSALYRCLSPDAAARPTAGGLRAILSGRDEKVRTAAAPATSARAAAPASSRQAGDPIMSDRIELSVPETSLS